MLYVLQTRYGVQQPDRNSSWFAFCGGSPFAGDIVLHNAHHTSMRKADPAITSYKLHTKQDRSARHHACCLLPDTMRAVCCCLPSVSCMLPGACCMLHDARCMMNDSDACCTLHAAHCMLHVACRLLYGVCCLLYVAQFVLSVACCMLHAALVPTAPTTAGELSRFSPSSLPAALVPNPTKQYAPLQ